MRKKAGISRNGSVLIGSALFIAIMTLLVGNYLVFVSSGSIGVSKLNSGTKALYLAEAGLQAMKYQIMNQGSFSSISVTNADGSTYEAKYISTPLSIFDVLLGTVERVGRVVARGTVRGMSRYVAIDYVNRPPGAKNGAFTAHSNISTTGNITIDGRDHYFFGLLNGFKGTSGVSTTGSFFQQGNSKVGGNGIAPANPASSTAIQQNAPASSAAPWDVLGVSEGWYNSNITEVTSPPTDFIGAVRYNPPGGTWEGVNLGISMGILIVHNDTYTATMKNLHGVFMGIIVADNIEHINGDAFITGAVVTTNQAGNTIGNGNAEIDFSSGALNIAGYFVNNPSTWKVPNTGTWRELRPNQWE